jgi:hypothetical protein
MLLWERGKERGEGEMEREERERGENGKIDKEW